jgi:aldehyde:ferredoxin oxidoreductase
MEYLASGKILIVDLGTSEIREDELSDDLVSAKIGGAGITRYLYEQYHVDDPIILGTGLLTGTLYPASALALITARSPRTGNLCHCPVTLKVGVELKYAGFDYVVIKGVAGKPVYLWIHDGVADVSEAGDVWGKNVWETTDAWRKGLGDDLIQTMVIGEAGEAGSDVAQVCLNYWSGADRFGLGKLFGQKKLKGIAMRGMGLLEIADPEAFMDRCYEILDNVKAGAFSGKKGIMDICAALGLADMQEWISPRVHRHSACFNTPYATNTFVFLDEDPQQLAEPASEAPGVLISSPFAPVAFKHLGLSAEAAFRLLRDCARYGIDPVAAAELAGKSGIKREEDVRSSLARLGGSVDLPGKGVFSPWCPAQPLFSDFGISGDAREWWEHRQAVAHVFGIHPMIAVMAPQLTEESMLEMIDIGTGIKFTQDTLDAVVSYVRS